MTFNICFTFNQVFTTVKIGKSARGLYYGMANICIFSEFQVSTEKKLDIKHERDRLDMKHERDRLDRPVFILVLVFVLFYDHNKEC